MKERGRWREEGRGEKVVKGGGKGRRAVKGRGRW